MRINAPRSNWLTLEQAAFGFFASVDGRRFSFKNAIALINSHSIQSNDDRSKFEIAVNPWLQKLILKDLNGGNNRLVQSLDDVLAFDEFGSEKYKALVNLFNELRLPDSLISSFAVARNVLLDAVRQAVDERFALAFARVASPLTPDFTEIPADAFRAFKIENFKSGYAVAVDGSRLFGLHLEPKGSNSNNARSTILPPKQASFARFLLHNHAGRWPDSPWKTLLSAFEQWTDVQSGSRTRIGRSLAAALKSKFPDGFANREDPMDKNGRL